MSNEEAMMEAVDLEDRMNESNGSAEENEKVGLLRRVNSAVENFMRRAFFRLGMLVTARPVVTIVVMIVVAALFCIGLLAFEQESRATELWVPQGTEALENEKFVEDNFGTQGRFLNTIVTGKPTDSAPENAPEGAPKSANVANQAAVLAFIQTVGVSYSTSAKDEDSGNTVTLQSFCETSSDASGLTFCTSFSVLDLFFDRNFLTNDSNGQPDFLQTIKAKVDTLSDTQVRQILTDGPYVTWNGVQMEKAGVVAQVNGADESLYIGAFRITQLLQSEIEVVNGEEIDHRASAWESQWTDDMVEFRTSSALNVEFESASSQEDSLSTALNGDIGLFTIGFVLLIVYTLLFLGQFHFVYSRWVAGLVLFGTIGLALGSTYGLSSAFGLFFGPVHQVLPLLILGLGVDDGFVIVRALDVVNAHEHHKNKPVRTRISLALAEAGTAITVTSITNACVFFISSVTKLPALRSFSLWAGIAVLMDFLFSVTLFTAYLSIDERRREARRFDVICCKAAREPVKTTNWFGREPGVLERFFAEKWTPLVLNRFVRIAVLVFFTALFGVCIWGTVELKLNFDFSYFYPDNTLQKDYYDTEQAYFGDLGANVGIYAGEIEYGSESVQRDLLALCAPDTGSIAQNQYIRDDSVTCWYYDMRSYYNLADGEYFAANEFSSQLASYLAADGAKYLRNINMTDSGVILATRFFAQYKPLETNEEEVDSMHSLRETASDSGVPGAFPFFFGYIFWEQYAIVRGEALLAICLSLVMVFVVALLLIGHPLVALIVLVSLGFSLVDILGIVHFWGIDISSVSVICLSLAVGLSVDFTVHIAKAFMDAAGDCRRDRVQEALRALGPPVLHAGISTFLAIFVLIGAKSFIFRVFFRCFLLIILLGLAHGFMFVPVILSFIGPRSFFRSEAQKAGAEDALVEQLLGDTGEKADVPSDGKNLAGSEGNNDIAVSSGSESGPHQDLNV
mmetsp:Transcript_16582/g.36034  ORF Transcript_16582/g.36034 Transcript_16582/m.36034 type:complete len:965 (+) Transcript_16582:64-2958(+)